MKSEHGSSFPDMSPQPRGDVIKHLLSVRKEIDVTNPNILAVVTTSPEMLMNMLRTGVLQDRLPRYPHAPHIILGRPTPAHAKEFVGILESLESTDELNLMTKSDAGVTARVHHFIANTGLPFDDNVMKAVDNYLFDHNPTMKAATGVVAEEMDVSNLAEAAIGSSVDLLSFLPHMPQARIDELIRQGDRRQGFRIAIASDAGATVVDIIDPAYADQYGKRVGYSFGPDGMPYTAIVAIEPLGHHGKSNASDLLDQLAMGVLPTD